MTDHIIVALELLEDVRAEVHGDVDYCVIEQLDEAIWVLKEAQLGRGAEISLQDVLDILGRVLSALPIIVELLKTFRHCQ